jgi:hypothetical protein
MSKIFSEQTEKNRQLITGLKNNLSVLKPKGLDEDFIKQLESDNNLLMAYNDENGQIRADLKAKINRANRKLEDTKTQAGYAKKIIKRDFEQDRWQYFGINDKR